MIEQKQDLIKLSKHELLRIATDLDVKYRTRMAKSELVDNIIDVLHIKKKDVHPDEERMLTEQLKAYQSEEAEVSSAKEVMEASKYTHLESTEKPQKAEELRAQTEPQSSHPAWENDPFIPEGYGDNQITAMVIDPTHLYAYWETTEQKLSSLLQSAQATNQPYSMVVKVHDVTDIVFNGQNAWSTTDVQTGYSKNWYFVVNTNRSYCLELGLRLANSRFLLIARSNIVCTPREGVSDFYDEEWMMIDFNKNKDLYNELYRLSGGHLIRRTQLNSGFITEYGKDSVSLAIPPQALSSESLSSQVKEARVSDHKDFWLWVDTELIVHGQTKTTAKELTINGEKIILDKEGRFRLHMALPNGTFPFHVQAISSDGTQHRSVTPVVTRRIEN